MSLLRRIQDAVVDPQIPVTQVLFQAKVLAARLGHEPLKRWVDLELNGYMNGDTVPQYRKLNHVESLGVFAGPFGAQMKNVPIPPMTLPDQIRDKFTTFQFREPIGSYVSYLQKPDDDSPRVPWPADLVVAVAHDIYEGYALLSAWMRISKGSIVAVVDAVRSKALDLVSIPGLSGVTVLDFVE